MTCSSLRGCSSTLAARKSAQAEIAYFKRNNVNLRVEIKQSKPNYVSMKLAERVKGKKPVHVHYSGIDH